MRFESEDETAWTLDGERFEPTKTIIIENVPFGMEFILPKHISFASKIGGQLFFEMTAIVFPA